MDQRTKNRFAEHGPHGLVNTNRTSPLQPGRQLWRCPCSWLGWLDDV